MVTAKIKEVTFHFDDGSYYTARPTSVGDTACGHYATRIWGKFITRSIRDFIKRVNFLSRLTWIQHPIE